MNERIREIALQCNFTEQDIIDMSPGFEKFAELIVRECIRRCEKIVFKHQVKEDPRSSGKKTGAFECVTELKERFGVQ